VDLIDRVRMDVVPVVFGVGWRCFGSVHAQQLLKGPDEVIQGNQVLHLRYRVRRCARRRCPGPKPGGRSRRAAARGELAATGLSIIATAAASALAGSNK
jgi:hypothetical protein